MRGRSVRHEMKQTFTTQIYQVMYSSVGLSVYVSDSQTFFNNVPPLKKKAQKLFVREKKPI